jgi:hypothetical protein
MKLDQEIVVKHQFWFLLGGYFLVWFIAILWMKFTYPDEIQKLQGDYKKATDGVKQAQSAGPVNVATFLPPWEKETKDFSDHKLAIWQSAWDYQKGMYDWPTDWVKKYDMTNPAAPLSADDRTEYKDKLYPNQIEFLRTNAPKWLNPVELKDGFDSVFNPLTKKDWKEIPTREEVWLAQEDYWVKRELLVVVYEAVLLQSLMEPVEIDEKKEPMPKGVEVRNRYRNKNWEITLNIRKSDKGLVIGGDSTIKNIHASHHPQALTSAKGKGIWFNVSQDNVRTSFEVRGEPVSWNDTKPFSAENYPDPLSGIKWDKDWLKDHPIVVSQGFDSTNAPIRRINAIELAKPDCRSFVWPLQPNHMLAQLDALPEENDPSKAAGAGAGGGGPGGPGGPESPGGGAAMMQQAMMSGRGPGMPGGPSTPAGNKTPNNDIERNRYLQPKDMDKKLNPPSHHLPLAIQLVVEQSHIHNVLLALANSRLRFQITQVEFNHDKNYTPQTEGDKEKKESGDVEGPRVFTGGPGMGTDRSIEMRRRMMMETQMRGRLQAGPGNGRQGGPPPGPMGSGAMGGRGLRGPMAGPGGPQMPGGPVGSPMMRPPMPGIAMGTQAQMKQSYTYAPGSMRAGGAMGMGTLDPKQSTSNQQDDNLVELTVYGIATLYRSPDAPQSTEQPGQPGAPATQTVQQPAATATPPTGGAQPSTPAPSSGGTPPPAPTPSGSATPPATGTKAPSDNATPPKEDKPKADKQPESGSPPPSPKQPDKQAPDQQKAPPPSPQGGKKN